MPGLASIIAAGARRVRGHADRLLVGIPPARAARRAVVGGVEVAANHPSFIFGHLALYPARVMRLAGLDPAAVAVPPDWEALFKAGAACVDDPHGSVYPPLDRLTDAYRRGYDATIAAIEGLPDAALMAANPDESYRTNFPLVGNALLVLLCSHPAMHLGQLSTWRRCEGLPPA
ncbi:MAG: DinB family protein [Phycisphaerales bacterium]